jgi:TusA-related sulfurtransferase
MDPSPVPDFDKHTAARTIGCRPRRCEMATLHTFDAGMMGCAEGLNQEFKRQLEAIPVGDMLEVIARDPVAKEDLPAFARLLGNRVESVEMERDASIHILIERLK